MQASDTVKDAEKILAEAESSGSRASRSDFVRRELPKVGFYFSAAYLVFLAVMAVVAWDKLFLMSPSEFGDMLAGCFAPLAFLWLVLGFFQQGQELQASVRALELQGRELQNSVEQQRELVKVGREQIERDVGAWKEERDAQEFAAQPKFVPSVNANFMGGAAKFRLNFTNAGADVTQVVIWVDQKRHSEFPIVEKGKPIAFSAVFTQGEKVEDITGFISYYDARGEARARRFHFFAEEGGGPGGRDTIAKGKIDDGLFLPPFPWE